MSINRVALRNLSRNKIKTILTLIAIVVGVSYYIYSACQSKGMRINGFLNLINYESGAVQLYSKNYYKIKDEQPLYESINNSSEIISILDKDYFTASRVRFKGSIVSPEKEMPFNIIAVNPDREREVFLYPTDISPKNISNGSFEMVMGYRAALELGIEVGDPVRLIADIEFKEADRIKTITQLLDFTVVGLVTSTNTTVSKNTAFIPLDILQDENGMMLNGNVTEIVVRDRDFGFTNMPTNKESVSHISEILLKEDINSVDVKNWTLYDINQVRRLSTSDTGPIFLFLTLLIIMLMSNTMLLSVMDRTKEIALLRAMGMDNLEIFKLLATEAGFLGLFGAVIGVIVGYLITFDSVTTGTVLTNEIVEAQGLEYTITGTIRSLWSIKAFFTASIAALLTSIISAAVPTISVLKMNIIKGIRNE